MSTSAGVFPAGPAPPVMTEAQARSYIERQRAAAQWALSAHPKLTDPDVQAELFDNPFFYFPTALWVEDKDTHKLIPLVPKPVQVIILVELLVDFYRGVPVRLIILKARREGVSTIVQAFFFWICTTRSRRKAFTIAQDDETTKYLHGMSEGYYMHMPGVFRPKRGVSRAGSMLELKNPTKDVDAYNANPGLESSMRSVTLKNAGAGQGSTLLHLSEVALWTALEGEKALQTVLKIVPRAPETVIVRESTARGVANRFHVMWQRAVTSVSEYRPIFIPWHWEPTYRAKPPLDFTRTPEEVELADEHGLEDDQLWWRRLTIENECDGDLDNFHQEFPITPDEAFLSSGRPFFPPRKVKDALTRARAGPEPIFVGNLTEQAVIDNDSNGGRGWIVPVATPGGLVQKGKGKRRRYSLVQWETNDPADDYLIAGDAAGGNPLGDFHAAYVYRRSTLRIVAAYHAKVEREEYGDDLFRLGKLYPGVTASLKRRSGALIAVEITGGWGQVPVSVLKWRGYPRIYARPTAEDELSRDQGDHMGWDSTIKTRVLALDTLKKSLGDLECYDDELYDECTTFVYNDVGKPEAAEGCWDDRVLAASIGCYLWSTHPRRHAAQPQKPRRALSAATGW